MKLAALFVILSALCFAQASAGTAVGGIVEPSGLYSVGAGVSGLGPAQPFGYYSLSQRIAAGTYTTEVNEFARLKGGKVATCARAGASKAMWSFGVFTLGLVGDAGACEAATGSASGAFSARGFVTAKIGKTNIYFIGTGDTLTIAGSGKQTIVSFGIGYGK